MNNLSEFSMLPGISFINSHIESIFDSLTASAYWKNKDGSYIGVNKAFMQASHVECYDDVIGKKDSDLIWCNEATILERNDQEVMRYETAKTVIEPCKSYQDNTIKLFLSHKVPLRSKTGKIIGTFGLSFLVDGNHNLGALIENANTKYRDLFKKNYSLSIKQMDCVYHLSRGMTMKQIGKVLHLSPRTVEHYLDAAKDKLGCTTRFELIAKALDILKSS